MIAEPPAAGRPAGQAPRESQLDGLRLLAFLAVFAHHADEARCPWGGLGVEFFFALSGFLITRILVGSESGRIGVDLRRYYIRRTLRIFPLYYLTIALAWYANPRIKDLGYLLTFTLNIKRALEPGLDRTLGHFWTLCVEEQFYLLYPLVLLATPRRARFPCLGVMIAGSVAFQAYAATRWNLRAVRILLPFCGEHLLWGCVAGLIDLRHPRPRRCEGATCFLAGWPLLALGWGLHERRLPLPGPAQDVASVTITGVACALIVFGASRCTARWIVAPLAAGPVAALGRISYGLYALHMPMLNLWYYEIYYCYLFPRVWASLALTVGLAALSWRYFEGPINRLKDRFAPPEPAPGAAPAGAVMA